MDELRRSAGEMAVLEANAVAAGATLAGLMENAGRAVAEEALRLLPGKGAPVAILAGAGNNGGDGTCAAHYLEQGGARPEVWLPRPGREVRSAAARRCLDRIAHRIPVHEGVPAAEELRRFPLLLDALLGTGQSGAPRPPYSEAVRAITASGVPVLSIDEPTGLGSAVAVHPRATVTFTSLKEGMDDANSGRIVLRDIGIPESAKEEVGPGEFHLYPLAPADPRVARILVLAGGPFAGAAALTALAALRAGAERATVICPRSALHEIRGYSPNLVVVGLGEERFRAEDAPEILRFLSENRHHALATGMGAGRDPGTIACLARVLSGQPPDRPAVIDADGLESALEAASGVDRPWVLTPNAGELLRLTGLPEGADLAARREAVRKLAQRHGVTFLAKGDPDLLVDGRRTLVNRHHVTSAMVSGVGDVLSGVVAALLGEGAPPLAAARLAAYWVGDAGIRAGRHRGHGTLATDVLEELPHALVEGRARLAGA